MTILLSPITIRDVTIRNRTVVSPMCQYSANMGLVNDYHLVHLGRFALGGFGLVYFEATGVEPRGRIAYGCPGLWSDAHIPPLKRITDFLRAYGAKSIIQLAHSGRKGSADLPFNKNPTDAQKPRLGYEKWQPVAPSPLPHDSGSQVPHELTVGEIASVVQSFADAATRATMAGFDMVEIHSAHGYLLNQFLSPLANRRTDRYGGSRDNRMRLLLEVVEAVRGVLPDTMPLFVRLSVQDWNENGWQIDDSIVLAKRLKALGVDVIDCSSGGFSEGRIEAGPNYQVPFAAAVREGADIRTMAVGLITDPHDAERFLREGKADLIALARPALANPNWPADAARALEPDVDHHDLYSRQSGYAVRALHKAISPF